MQRRISPSTVRRLSHYLRALEELQKEGGATVSSEELAERGDTSAAQVRKDLSNFGSFGKRGLGYGVEALLQRLREILGVDRVWRVALVGAGRVGSALFEYPNFKSRGFEVLAIFDVDPGKIGSSWGGVRIQPVEELVGTLRTLAVEMAILAVPAAAVQEVADGVVAAGVKGILNFAPTRVRVPEQVAVEHVNLVMELEALSFAITRNPADR